MALIPAVITNAARAYYPQFFGRILGISAGLSSAGNWNPLLKTFKIGRGGWIDPGGGKEPRTPDPELTDLDIVIDYSRDSEDKRYIGLSGNIMFVEKTLGSLDLTYSVTDPYTLTIKCQLGGSEANDIQGVPSDPPGGATLLESSTQPEFWEIGVFSEHPSGTGDLMVLYATFPGELKLVGSILENTITLSF